VVLYEALRQRGARAEIRSSKIENRRDP